MKKILTITVMTAILATTGFAASPTNDETSTESKDPVEAEAYGVVNFEKGTDRFPTTIMPSGIVNIGGMAYIASKWTFGTRGNYERDRGWIYSR